MPGQAPGRIFALSLALTALITPLAVHLFFPVIPVVKVALGLTDAGAQLTFTISLFGMAVATLFYGTLSDRFGRRPVLLSGLTLFMIGTVVSTLAQTPITLVLGRLIQAIGAGCGLTLVRAIARDAYRAEHLVNTLGWRSVFGFALLAGGAITLIAYAALHETHPAASRSAGGVSVAQSYIALLRRPRFNAFVLQSGFITGSFMVMATASATLMTELLHRPATEFGLYFLLFPVGFFIGNVLSSRVGNRVATETMVLAGSALALASVCAQAIGLWYGLLTPLVFFLPGTFLTMAQGIALPYAQVGAMAEIPRFAGTAAGIGVFMQHFCAAAFAQLYGVLADGTPLPMSAIAVLCGVLTLAAGAVPLALKRLGRGPEPA
jgi:DHA1 family bicyclomycin/chloramphenicol resistance-like MFS transporter